MTIRITINGVLEVEYSRESDLHKYALLDEACVKHIKDLITHTVGEARKLSIAVQRQEKS